MPASFIRIMIDGQVLYDFSPGAILETVEVRQELNDHSWCDLVCRQTVDQRFPVEDSLGKDLQIFGVDDQGNEKKVFDGLILESELEYEVYGTFRVLVRGVTRSYKLDLTPRQAYYRQESLEDVANKLAGLAGLDVSLTYKPREPPYTYVQWGETDFEFLKRLADDHDCWIRPTDNGIEILDTFQEADTKISWRAEDGLRSFKIKGKLGQPSMNGAHYQMSTMQSKVFKEVKEDPDFFDGSSNLADAVKAASADKLDPGYVYQRARVITIDDYEKLLKKESARAIGGKVTGEGSSRNEDLLPGNTLAIEGSLDAQGTYGLTKVVHNWTANGYTNQFSCTMWKNYTSPEPPKMHKWAGIVPARVVANDDPAKLGRVKVQFYWQEESETLWTRTMTPHAGSGRGFYFLPEVGDEVIVAFGDGDPERPAVVGSVWNGVDKAPTEDFWGGEFKDNDCKRIVTKSGHRVQLVDKKGKETISLATPKHIKIAMIENSNENGRATMMLHCDGDIFINAGGRIHMKSAFYSREVG